MYIPTNYKLDQEDCVMMAFCAENKLVLKQQKGSNCTSPSTGLN